MDTNLPFASLAARVVVATAVTLAFAAHAGGSATSAARPAAWVDAGPTKPNGSGVRLRYTVAAGLQPGQTATVQLEFSGVKSADARAEWRVPAGVAVASSTGGNITSVALTPGQTTTVSLQVTPSADGMAYLDVFTTQGGRGTAQSVPLAVGSGKVMLEQNGSAKTTPSGEKVISLPSTPR